MNIEPNNEYLEDDCPFQSGDLQVPATNFPGRDTKGKKKMVKLSGEELFVFFGKNLVENYGWLLDRERDSDSHNEIYIYIIDISIAILIYIYTSLYHPM